MFVAVLTVPDRFQLHWKVNGKKRQVLEKLLSEEKERWQQAEIERQKVEQLEKALGMERLRRQETEKTLFEKQKKEELDRLAAEEKARKELLTEKAISERLPDKVGWTYMTRQNILTNLRLLVLH